MKFRKAAEILMRDLLARENIPRTKENIQALYDLECYIRTEFIGFKISSDNGAREYKGGAINDKNHNAIRKILKLAPTQQITNMYMFEDGQIHHDNIVYFDSKKPKIHHLNSKTFDELLKNLPENNLKIFRNDAKSTDLKMLMIIDKKYSYGYGQNRIILEQGDWLLDSAVLNQHKLIGINTAIKEGIYAIECNEKGKIISDKKILPKDHNDIFSAELLTKAAKWWAEYLPDAQLYNPYKNADGFDLKSLTKSLVSLSVNEMEKDLNKSQKDNFIKILSEKIKQSYKNGKNYISIGSISVNETDDIIIDAAKEAGIQAMHLGTFPEKTLMKIFPTGQISINGKFIEKGDKIQHIGLDDICLSNFIEMQIIGADFRIIELNLIGFKGNLFRKGSPGFTPIDVNNEFAGHDKLYIKIYKNYFKDPQEFFDLQDSELIEILQSPAMISFYFTSKLSFVYNVIEKNLLSDNFAADLGYLSAHKAHQNFYTYKCSNKTMVAPRDQPCYIGTEDLTLVQKGDFIIYSKELGLTCIRSSDKGVFKAYDPKTATFHLPGTDTLEELMNKSSKRELVYSVNFKN